MNAARRLGVLLIAAALYTFLAGAAAADPGGDAERGRALFTAKQCARCHAPRGQAGVGPPLTALQRPQGAFELAGRLWNHAPTMFTVLTQERVEWPAFTTAEMADLMAYLGADPARDPAPSAPRGNTVLLRKGCLKCHSLGGEGGRIAADLSRPRPAYQAADTWAAAMWTHTPRMAAKALEIGVVYPRFVDDEMIDLVGFLRTTVKAP